MIAGAIAARWPRPQQPVDLIDKYNSGGQLLGDPKEGDDVLLGLAHELIEEDAGVDLQEGSADFYVYMNSNKNGIELE